jgi:hypothetical protein
MAFPREFRGIGFWGAIGLLAGLGAPASGAVRILSVTPSPMSSQPIGHQITWKVRATDSQAGPLTFQFNVAPPGSSLALARDFNVGTAVSGVWGAQPFLWTPTGIEGSSQIQVVIKDFNSGEIASQTVTFKLNPLVTGTTGGTQILNIEAPVSYRSWQISSLYDPPLT